MYANINFDWILELGIVSVLLLLFYTFFYTVGVYYSI